MKYKRNNFKDYKVIHIISPADGNSFYYVYHYKIGFSATFKSVNDVEKYLESF